jgi:hypothetical protein
MSAEAKRMVYYFDEPGPQNTDDVFKAVIERVKEKDIEAVVVASNSGRTALKLAKRLQAASLKIKMVCVTGPPSWEEYGYEMPLLKRKERQELEKLGVQIVDQIEESFRELHFRNWWLNKTIKVEREKADLFWMTLICVGGHGVRTAVEVVFMALEADLIKPDQKVIGVAGTGEGADSGIVLHATRFEDVVGPDPDKRLKIEEILAMPKQTTWAGYG